MLMQNQVYSRYLYQVLMEFGKVCVPSLGTFALDYHQASFGQDKKNLLPPFTTISFSSFEDNSCFFQQQLCEIGMDESDANLLQRLLIEDFQLSKIQNSSLHLHGLGKINGDSFLPDDATFFNKYKGLGIINAIPLPTIPAKIQHDDNYIYGLNGMASATKNKTSTTSYWWPLAIGLLTLFVVLYWLLSDKSTPTNSSDIQPVTNITDTLLLEDSSTVAIDTVMVSVDTNVSSNQIINTEVIEPITAAPIQPSTTCVVIVGAFKKDKNADQLLKKIASKGYKPYSAHYNGLQRIGIAYDCQSIDPDSFKTKVQKTFNMQAWHLHDTI